MAWWDEFRYYPPSRPRAARGGIKAQSKRGTFGESWWARRWIEVLEGFQLGARLHRGRAYARRGQVLSIDIGKGTVSAQVQGSRPDPYRVQIAVKTLSKAEWKRLARALGRQAVFTAKLLAGRMPGEIEKVFETASLSLFPSRSGDLQTECSCPDWANPCKHIAAVYYLLGEEFHRDPFLIFRLRGIEREELIGLIGDQGTSKRKGAAKKLTQVQADSAEEAPEVALPAEPDAFWGKEGTRGEFLGEVRLPPVNAALLKRLGSFPFWRGEEDFADVLEKVYREAGVAGLDVFLGERKVIKER